MELNGLKNKITRATQQMKDSVRQRMMNVDIDKCDYEELRINFTTLKTDYQKYHGRVYDSYHIRTSKPTQRVFFSKEETCLLPISYKFWG
jgi:hypothetical protein